jgi:hypothetical protein
MLYSGRAQLSHIIYCKYIVMGSVSEASKMAGCVFSACHFFSALSAKSNGKS